MTTTRRERGMVEPDLSRAAWHKSSYSGGNGSCIEVADLVSTVAIRDSKNPDGPKLLIAPSDWQSFVRTIRTGAHDL
jgi:Domain of unknown function (DUF397)